VITKVSTKLDRHDLDSNLENQPRPWGFPIMRIQPHYEENRNLLHPLGHGHLRNSRIVKEDPNDQRDILLLDLHYVDQLYVHFSLHSLI